MRQWLLGLMLVCLPVPAQATIYYLSPTGSNANNGLTSATPWLTFAYAFTNTVCGDVLLLLDGTYGDGTSTGKINLSGRVCSQGTEFTIQAFNQRQAKIFDNGSNKAVYIATSAYVTIDGLFAKSTDNSGSTASASGTPFGVRSSNHITIRNSLANNVNRYANSHMFDILYSQDVLLEDNEAYVFHRHCVVGWQSERVVVRRQYCNPRGGRIAGGYNEIAGLNGADSLLSMYPCKDCLVENSIADGTTTRMYLTEMNSTYGSSILMSGAKVLGSICYKCDYGNGIYLNARSVADLNHTPQNITIRDVAFVDQASNSPGIRVSDGVNISINHVSILGTGVGAIGMMADDTALGATPAEQSITIANSIVTNMSQYGYRISGPSTWGGNYLTAYNNSTNFSPVLPSNWTNTSTTDPGLGTCTLWTPDVSANKGTGSSGSDRGATILYRYINGVLTDIPLWSTFTAEFPYGAADPDGVNRVSGQSLFDMHTRLNVNAGGCSFPAGYGTSGGGGGTSTVVQGTTAASALTTTATPLTWDHTISASQDYLLVCVGLWHSGASVGSVSAIDVSGQAMTLVKRQVTSPDAYRAAELWKLAAPTNGLRTVTVTLTGSISGALGRSMEFDSVSGLNTATGASTAGAATSLTVTALTNTNELVTDCTVSSKSVSFTHGADQTGYDNLSHDTQALLLAASTQNGAAGGVMSNATGGAVLQAKVAVSLIASPADPATGAVLTGTQYQIFNGFGHETTVAQAAVKNTQARIGPEGFVRIRGEIEASVAVTDPFTPALYCNDGAGYVPVLDTFGSNKFRYYGIGPESTTNPIPSTGSGTLQKLNTGQFQGGAVLRDSTTAYVVPTLNPGERVEMEAVIQFNGAANDVVTCRWYRNDGTALTYGANGTASILITPAGAVAGY